MTDQFTTRDEKLWNEAYITVAFVRGSNDAPGFDACVQAEYDDLVRKRADTHRSVLEGMTK